MMSLDEYMGLVDSYDSRLKNGEDVLDELTTFQNEYMEQVLKEYEKSCDTPAKYGCFDLLDYAIHYSTDGDSIIYEENKEIAEEINNIVTSELGEYLLDAPEFYYDSYSEAYAISCMFGGCFVPGWFEHEYKNIEKENKEMNENMNLSAPWMIFCDELDALFEDDEEVRIEYYPDETEVKLFISSVDKSYALMKLLPKEKEFGNVLLKITVVPANADTWKKADLLRRAFKDNPAVVNIIEDIPCITSPTGSFNFVEFKKSVVQFYADNIRDPRGYMSMLYQDIARDAFKEDPDVAYCTSICDDECDEE